MMFLSHAYIRFFLVTAAVVGDVVATTTIACDSAPTATITAGSWKSNSTTSSTTKDETKNGESGMGRRDPDVLDALSLANVLLTAVPESLRQIAATNLPAASTILWSEFLDGSRPAWFVALPTDIQSYLVRQFGPQTASAVPTPSIPVFSSATPPVSSARETSVPVTTRFSTETKTNIPLSGSSRETATFGSSKASKASSLATSRLPTTKFVTSVVTISAGTIVSGKVKPTESPNTSVPPAPEEQHSGMSRNAKIGLGVGIPISILGAGAILFVCCFLVRRRRKQARAPVRPSPDFIPESAFHQKSPLVDDTAEHPLIRDGGYFGALSGDTLSWGGGSSSEEKVTSSDEEPKISPPLLLHTHTSKRGRGKRTSYTSLQSVPEDPEMASQDGIINGYRGQGKGKGKMPVVPPPTSNRLSPTSPIGDVVRPKVKRKPVGSGVYHKRQKSEEELLRESTESLLYPKKNKQRTDSGFEVSGIANPFADRYGLGYLEDYGPEYSRGYEPVSDRSHMRRHSFDQSRPGTSKTQFPFRSERRSWQRTKSPLWDPVDEEE